MNKTSRRKFLKKAVGISASLGYGSILLSSHASVTANPKGKVKLAISSYPYWHFTRKKLPIEVAIDDAAELGVAGVDILHRQMESEESAYLNHLKQHAWLNRIV